MTKAAAGEYSFGVTQKLNLSDINNAIGKSQSSISKFNGYHVRTHTFLKATFQMDPGRTAHNFSNSTTHLRIRTFF